MDISNELMLWYSKHKRDLPWRNTNNPYKIWLSEVILQQTRVDQGLSYYESFIATFPTIQDLASAEEEAVLKLWQGLGYYSRARNLRKTAQEIFKNWGGRFPENYDDLILLKGIGPYTAAAIASFAFNKKHAVVDGNVYRVLSRVFGITEPIDSSIGKKIFSQLANELIPSKKPAEFNQAIMEFGAMHCTPKQFDCASCCLLSMCFAAMHNKQLELPVKQKKTKQRIRYFNYLFIQYKDFTWINRRGEGDIWQGLYEFPLFESSSPVNPDNKEFLKFLQKILAGKKYHFKTIIESPKHILSHQILQARFLIIQMDELTPKLGLKGLIRTPIERLSDFAWPRLIEKFLEKNIP